MSRKSVKFDKPTMVLGVLCEDIGYGLDHILGYFVQGYLGGKCVLDRESSNRFGNTMSNSEFAVQLRELGLTEDADNVFLDLPI